METGKVNTILQQLSTEKHQWWGTQKVRGFLQRCKTSRLSRRRETVRPREVVPRPANKLLSCLRLNADLLTVTITMSSCQWPLIVVADSGCVVVLCAVVLVSWPESGVRHCNIALDRSSHFRKRLPTSLVNFVRGANTAAIDCAKAGEEGRVRGVICEYREYVTRPPHSTLRSMARLGSDEVPIELLLNTSKVTARKHWC